MAFEEVFCCRLEGASVLEFTCKYSVRVPCNTLRTLSNRLHPDCRPKPLTATPTFSPIDAADRVVWLSR